MRLPIKQPRAASILSLPDLAGGLNMRDGLSEVLDNQLTDCKNMWWRDGVLKTRPGMQTSKERIQVIGRYEEQEIEIKNFPSINYVIGNKSYFLQVVKNFYYNSDGGSLRFYWIGEEETVMLKSITLSDARATTYFVCIKKDTLYCFTSDKKVYKFDITTFDYELEKFTADWVPVSNSEYYVPLVATYCNCTGSAMQPKEVLSSGVAIDGFNILSDYYKLEYNAYNPEIDDVSKTGHSMKYGLLDNTAKKNGNSKIYLNKTVTVKYTDENGTTYEHKVEITNNTVDTESTPLEDGFRIRVYAQMVVFLKGTTDSVAIITEKNSRKNNIEIIAPYIVDEQEKQKIFNMTRCEWFGGVSEGISGGTRLFLCGNDKESSLVAWSGLNDPLYFPENSYFYVGDTTSKVTAFGKQSDMLVIFKENETWYTKYQQNTNITAEDLINQSIVDYAGSSVYFPLVQINSNIGCIYPDTIQLCRNRLVWFGNENKVYTLVSESQYNERSVFCVSEMIERKFEDYDIYYEPTSCDWNGHYCLCFDKEIYLMDYNCYGYTHISSYSKTEDANIRIPWVYWVMPEDGIISSLNGAMVLSYYHDGVSYDKCSIVNNVLTEEHGPIDMICIEDDNIEGKDGLIITEKTIPSMLQTKLFDFGVPHIRKNIEQLNIQLGNNGGEPIKVTFITENGTDETEIMLDGEDTYSYSAGFIESRAVFPCIKQVLRFGLKLECNGRLAADSVILKYRILGGAR